MRRTFIVAIAVLTVTPTVDAQTEPSGSDSNSIRGSFQPPLSDPTNEATYLYGTGLLTFADPLTLYGVVAGMGLGFGSSERPRFGIEAGVVAMTGGGTMSFGLEDLDVHASTFAGSAVIKFRALDPADGHLLGLTVYGGPNLGYFQFGTTNANGTARRHALQAGALGGILGQIFILDTVEVMLFAGGRAMLFGFFEEDGDPDSPEPTAAISPDFGGNITVHLPGDLDLSLGSVINFFSGEDDEKGTARTFVLGLSWTPGGGVAPVIDTATPEVTP